MPSMAGWCDQITHPHSAEGTYKILPINKTFTILEINILRYDSQS